MKQRDFLWCALNLMLDGEEAMSRLCPSCRAEAEAERCPACGVETGGGYTGENAAFDRARFDRMMQGEET